MTRKLNERVRHPDAEEHFDQTLYQEAKDMDIISNTNHKVGK